MSEILCQLQRIRIEFLDRLLLKIDDLKVHKFEKIGLVAPNGTGKTTLLNLISGKLKPNKGSVSIYGSVGYFEQKSLPTYTNEINFKIKGELQIPNSTKNLSGGELSKLKFLELINNNFELLLIDEITSHMDSRGVDFVIEYLKYLPCSLIIVSHDRHILNQLVETVWEIEDQTVKVYSGNYDEYKKQKELNYQQLLSKHEYYTKEKERLTNAIREKKEMAKNVTNTKGKREFKNKPGLHQTKSKGSVERSLNKAAKNIEKRIELLETIELPESENKIQFYNNKIHPIHSPYPIIINYVDIGYREQVLIENVSLQVPLNSIIGIIGQNGTGKSTLLNYIYNNSEGVELSKNAKIGYFTQLDYLNLSSDKNQTILQHCKSYSEYDEGFIRKMLSKIRFKGNELSKKLKDLSGGELIRLKLMLLFIQDYNILLLDEPTNFLDIETIEVLEMFIKNYPGTIICISHDRYFIENISDQIFIIVDKKIRKKS